MRAAEAGEAARATALRATPARAVGPLVGKLNVPPEPQVIPVEPRDAKSAGLPDLDTATAPLVPIGPLDWDRALAVARARGDIELDALSARARQFHGALAPRAQRHRTTAVLSTDGPTIIGGGGVDLEEGQLRLLRDEEIYAKYPDLHAEQTVLSKAMALGYRPRALVTTRSICEKTGCEEFIRSMGGVISPDGRMAIFPP